MPIPPKDPSTRQRRNKASTHAVLPAKGPRSKPPELPNDREWHPLALEYWKEVWRSPMAWEYQDADVGGLLILITLVNEFWQNPSIKLASEIRLQRQPFGLSPVDRHRLQWQIAETEQKQAKRPKVIEAKGTVKDAADPRAALRAA